MVFRKKWSGRKTQKRLYGRRKGRGMKSGSTMGNMAAAAANFRAYTGQFEKPSNKLTAKRKAAVQRSNTLFTKRRKTTASNTGHDFQRRYNRTYKRPVSTRRIAFAAQQPLVQHYQGLTNFDTNTGFVDLSNSTSGEAVNLPIAVIQLTQFANNPIGDTVTPSCPLYKIGWAGASTSAGIVAVPIPGQQADNSQPLSPLWTRIKGQDSPKAQQAYLEWSNVKFNFYGARKRSTRFQVHLVSYKDEQADILLPGNALELKARNFLEETTKGLLYNNLTPRVNDWKKDVNIHKTWSYNVDATNSYDLNTATGKLMEAKIFLQHNRLMKMTNERAVEIQGHDHDADYSRYMNVAQNSPAARARLYLIVTAFAPERVAYADISAEESPSFDFTIRQKWQVPSYTSNY